MPDVTVSNPTVNVDLAAGESFTVPTNKQLHVTVVSRPDQTTLKRTGGVVFLASSGKSEHIVEIDLFGGDTLLSNDDVTRIRGYEVD